MTGRSVAESRMGLIANGFVKVPMQFGILFIGAMVFVFYLFSSPPVYFKPVELESARSGPEGNALRAVESRYEVALERRSELAQSYLASKRDGDTDAAAGAKDALRRADSDARSVRQEAVAAIRRSNPGSSGSDTNYVFLSFVLGHLPVGIIGLVLAAVFAASMSSCSAELNSLSSTTSVDIYKRFVERAGTSPNEAARREVLVGKSATVLWGIFAIAFAEYSSRLGSLIEAVNILGSLVYGTILGIFLAAFYLKRLDGTSVFVAALAAEAAVVACFLYTDISFLWYNVVGCMGVLLVSTALALAKKSGPAMAESRGR